jgi:thioredoxin 1
MANLPEVNDSNFEAEVTSSSLPVLVDFGAAWCGPCKQLAPIVEGIAKDYAGKLKVAYVDVDKAPNTAAKFGIMAVPTVFIFKGGKIVEQMTGFQSRPALDKSISRILG